VRIELITLRELAMRLKAPFETSTEVTWNRRILLVEVRSDGVSGWAEITAAEDPYFNAETTETAWHIFKDFIVPATLGKSVQTASEIQDLLAPIRGHHMAKAGMENAMWDVEAQQRGVPLATLIGGTRTEIPCGVSIGIQDSVESLIAAIEVELRAGYQRVKLKIKPGKDVDFITAARAEYPDIKLMVDANSAYQLKDADRLREFDRYRLTMIEQPLAWDDIYQHAVLQAQLETPICLDECIQTASHAQAAITLTACRVINIKLGRVGGHSVAKQVHDVCFRNSIPVWCGGMLESGVGRAHNIAMSALPGFSLPGDVSASRRYWDEDIIEPEVEVSAEGTIRVPASPGLGYTVRQSRVDALTVRREHWTAAAKSAAAVSGSPASSPDPSQLDSFTNLPDGIQIREVQTLAELRQVEALEQEVWGVTEREIVPLSLLIPAREVGAIILGAFDGTHLVGFSFGFVGIEKRQPSIHSHTLAVKPGYRDHNLGYRLKLAQREKALAMGVRQITWTFDPLQSRNAYLNFAKLGVLCDSYKANFYGEQSSSPLHQNGTDRLWVRWLLDSERVHQRIKDSRTKDSQGRERAREPSSVASLLTISQSGEPCPRLDERTFRSHTQVSIEIPIFRDDEPDRKSAIGWRTATRLAFLEALRAGFVVSDFYRLRRGSQEIGTYLLTSN
jgi:o-succinylbenzoate synthase